MSDGFSYRIIEQNTVVVVSLQGRLTKDAKDSLNQCQQELQRVQSKRIIFLFKDVTSVDHIVFRELTLIQSEVRKNGVSVVVTGLSLSLKQFLYEKGVIRLGEVRGSLAEALKTLAA